MHGYRKILTALGILTGILTAPQLGQGATFTVDSLFQAQDNVPGDGVCATFGGECSLQAAIDEANALAGSDTITLGTSQTYSLLGSCTGTCGADNALPDISTTITIDGNNSTLQMTAGNARFFDVSGTLTINNLTIKDANFNGGNGGAINVQAGATVTINNSILRDNDGCANASDIGGAISTDGTLNVNTSSLLNNRCVSGLSGGAIAGSMTSNITISRSSLTSNGTGFYGGGVAALGDLMITNSTIADNTAGSKGGGVYFSSAGTGTVRYSTIYDNTANEGGGIYNGAGSSLNLQSSIISTNTAPTSGPDCHDDTAITSDGYNHFSDDTNCDGYIYGQDWAPTGPPSIYDDGIDSGPFNASYGRVYYISDYTGTITEAGNPAYCGGTDMLGQTRGTLCDKGAVEQAWCGDSIVQTVVDADGDTESCDDGNTTSGDGCDAQCATESGGGGGGGPGNSIATVNDSACEAAHNANSTLSLGEALLLANGTLDYSVLTAGEQAQLTVSSGGSSIKCSGDGCSPVINCSLPPVNNALTIGSVSTPMTITASGLGTNGKVFDVIIDGVTIQYLTLVGDSGTAVNVSANSFTMKGVSISGFATGLKLDGVTTATIGGSSEEDANYFNGNYVGALAYQSQSLTFQNNVFGLTDGILADGNQYGLALIDVTNSTFTGNTLGANESVGLLVSGAANLAFYTNQFGTNVNGSRPLGTDWQTGTGAQFEILTESPSPFIPEPATTSITGITLGDSTNSAQGNMFCYNAENLTVSGSSVSVSIGLNDFCVDGSSGGFYTIREGANAGSGDTSLPEPDVSEVSASYLEGTTFTLGITGTAQAGTDVRLYKQEVASDATVGSAVYICQTDTDAVGNFEASCESEMGALTESVRILAQSCFQNCSVVSGFSAVTSASSVSLAEESGASAGAGYQNAQSGGGCSLATPAPSPDRKAPLVFALFITFLSLPYLKKRQGL